MKKLLLILALLSPLSLHAQSCPASVPSGITTCHYADFTNGLDTNNGTSEATPWKHFPGMGGCSSNCNAYSPSAGEGLILRGGITWPAASLPWNWNWSGTSTGSTPGCTGSGCIYIGVDPLWHTGATWTRPILNGSGNVNQSIFNMGEPGNFIVVDNLEMTGLFWSGTSVPFGTANLSLPGGSPNVGAHDTFEHVYIHGWSHGTYPGTDDISCGVTGDTNDNNENVGSIIEFSVISGADTDQRSCNGAIFGGPPYIAYNVMEYVASAMVIDGPKTVHDNLVQNIVNSFEATAHENGLEINYVAYNSTVYNNIIRHLFGSGALTFWVQPKPGTTTYVFNNLFYDTDAGNVIDLASIADFYSGAAGTTIMWNNTVECGPDTNPTEVCASGIGAGTTAVTFQNNHFITNSGSYFSTAGSTPVTTHNNVLQTKTTANGQGYTASQTNAFSPTSAGNSTVGAGLAATSLCSASGSTACGSTTAYGVAYNTSDHTVTSPGLATQAWNATPDVGAYQLSTGGTVATPTFSALSGTAPQAITISDATAGSTIFYTTDGSTPTPSSAVYLGVPIYLWTSQTIKAMAIASGFTDSAVGSQAYAITTPKTRFSLMRKTSSEVVTPTPLDDRPLPNTGCEVAQMEASNGTFTFTSCDAWFTAAATGGWKLTMAFQARPAWMTGLAANTDGPSSDWNTVTSCPTVGGIVLGSTKDCLWKTFMIRFLMHRTGLSTVPGSPVNCPNLDYAEFGNEVNTNSGSSIMVGFSGTPASYVQTSNDGAALVHQWCSNTLVNLGNFSAVVGSNGTGNPQFDLYAEDVLGLIGAANGNLYQGITLHTYNSRDNVTPLPPPTSNVSYSAAACTSGNTPNNSCYVPIVSEISTLRTNALQQAGTVAWSGNLPIYSDEGGFNTIGNLNGDNTYGSAWISEYIPLIAAQGEVYNMLYLANDSPCGSTNWGCYGVSPFNTATNQSLAWINAATSVGAATSTPITGGTMWTVPLNGGTSAIAWCAVQNPATCTTTTAVNSYQDINGTIHALSGTLTLSSTAVLLFNSSSTVSVSLSGTVLLKGTVQIK